MPQILYNIIHFLHPLPTDSPSQHCHRKSAKKFTNPNRTKLHKPNHGERTKTHPNLHQQNTKTES